MSSPEAIKASPTMAARILAADSPEKWLLSKDTSPMLLVKGGEKHADETFKDEGMQTTEYNGANMASSGGDDALGMTDHENSSSAKLESVHEHTSASKDLHQIPNTAKPDKEDYCHAQANDDMEDSFEVFSSRSTPDLDLDLEMFDTDYLTNTPHFCKVTHYDQPNFHHSTAMQNRMYAMLDNSDLFAEFINARNGGGRLTGYQSTWLAKHLARLRSVQGYGDEYMHLLGVTLALQEQLKATWDREDHALEAVEQSWMEAEGASSRKKAVREMCGVVGFGSEGFEGADGFEVLLNAAKSTLNRNKKEREAHRRKSFFAVRRAVQAGLKSDGFDAGWFPSQDGVSFLSHHPPLFTLLTCLLNRSAVSSMSAGGRDLRRQR